MQVKFTFLIDRFKNVIGFNYIWFVFDPIKFPFYEAIDVIFYPFVFPIEHIIQSLNYPTF